MITGTVDYEKELLVAIDTSLVREFQWGDHTLQGKITGAET